MLESNHLSAYDDPSTTFLGVHFLLLGFDSVSKEKIQSKLFEGGGVDAVNYGSACTHVIVDKLVYDDTTCVTARKDGKILVTGLWVDHSFDVGMTVDPTSIMYRPVRDFNGIPGAKSMIVCLTGYQRQDRDDIMTMVGLMGANFSKPLVANKVTHLICYKFEGEKYELAKKMKKIKLVNHLWLEECLKAWEILPETDYAKSGYELEIEAEAKDSEDETEDTTSIIDAGPSNPGMSRKGLYSSTPGSLANVIGTGKVQTTPRKDTDVEKSPFLGNTYGHIETPSARSSGKNSNIPSNILDRAMINGKADNIIHSPSKSDKKSPSTNACKISSKSILRIPSRKPSPSPNSGRIEGNSGRPSTSTVTGSLKLPMEMHQNGTDLHRVKTPSKGTNLQLDEGQMTSSPNKKKMTLPRGSSNSRRISHDFRTAPENESAVKTTDMLVSEFSLEGSRGIACHTSSMTKKHHLSDQDSLPQIEVSKIGVVSKDRQECNHDVLKSYKRGSKKRTPITNLEAEDHSVSRTGDSCCEVEMHQSDLQITEPPFLNTNIPVDEKSYEQANLNFSEKEHTVPPPRKKMIAKKTLSSRLNMGNGRTANYKGSIGLQKAMMQKDNIAHPNGAVSTKETNSVSIADKVTMADADKNTTPTNKLHATLQVATDEDRLVDDDTEASYDKTENEFDEATNEGKMAEFEVPDIGNMNPDERIGLNDIEKQCAGDVARTKLEMAKAVKDKNVASNKKTELDESNSPKGVREKILPKKKKRPAKGKRKVNEPEEESKRQESNTKPDGKETIDHNEETVRLVAKAKGRPSKKLKSSTDAEKENKSVSVTHQSTSNDTEAAEKVQSKLPKKSTIKSLNVDRGNSGLIKKVNDHEVKNAHACFILSGHKLQRKEFQQVIKRLKGKVCRDSHNWSYQATHFIVPDPIRRTEKFFAAAASGSWILKMDYLTASNEAGKFLSEKPYEWHQKGLSEDGAINLEAPRKWRLLRERTCHGAFYGMRFVIYGECIAPPLDTLKRVIKAGEGTILATSPPYSRFLQSGIDFAIVSPGMPRVDMWVQEFLRHEVPCVLADYLVDYVCKPGYSIDKHVQYNTQAWAEKSLESLVSRIEEESSDEPRTPEGHGTDDVACQVCESRDRGEEMMLCGDESGTVGCGVGIHLDCLDPPLDDVPEEDWFCPSCSKKREGTSIGGIRIKRSS